MALVKVMRPSLADAGFDDGDNGFAGKEGLVPTGPSIPGPGKTQPIPGNIFSEPGLEPLAPGAVEDGGSFCSC
nr:hypothetical protein Iba_chr05fCG10620 [Ipomoea batatas]